MINVNDPEGRRVKVSLSLDPLMVKYLDLVVADGKSLNRSRVVELAVREYQESRIKDALEQQYAEPESDEVQRELKAWRQVRRASILHTLIRD